MAPGRKSTALSPEQSTTVDSKPISVASPFRMQSILPLRSSNTACHVVGLGLPERLADGATTGEPHEFRKAWAISFRGILTPTVRRPAVATNGTDLVFDTTIVSGPGKKASINFWANKVSEDPTFSI